MVLFVRQVVCVLILNRFRCVQTRYLPHGAVQALARVHSQSVPRDEGGGGGEKEAHGRGDLNGEHTTMNLSDLYLKNQRISNINSSTTCMYIFPSQCILFPGKFAYTRNLLWDVGENKYNMTDTKYKVCACTCD